jgi:hypothetical protein
MMLRESLWRRDSEMELERVRSCLIDCWWARVRARRSELRCSERSSAEGGSPKMKNLMKKKIRSAIESWPSRKPCVKESLWGVSGVEAGVEEAVRGRDRSSQRRQWGRNRFRHSEVGAVLPIDHDTAVVA